MKTLKDRMNAALENDNSIVVSKEDLDTHKGFTEEYMIFLGLTSSDLKKLERKGVAKRGYVNSGTGKQVRWVLSI